MPQVSIITVNLNNSKGLRQTCNSIAGQTFRDFEHIIIDGGSNDGSLDIIKEYALSKSIMIKWISEPDKGIYQAMNKGIRIAEGNYCYFLNSGDYFVDKEVLNKLFKTEPSTDLITGNLIVITASHKKVKCQGKNELTLYDIYAGVIKHQSSLIKRSLFYKLGFYNEDLKIIADWEFFMRTIGFKAATVKYIDVDIAYFDNDGISNRKPDECKIERQIVLNDLMPMSLQKDYLLLHKYSGLALIDRFALCRLGFRVLAKAAKIFS